MTHTSPYVKSKNDPFPVRMTHTSTYVKFKNDTFPVHLKTDAFLEVWTLRITITGT